MTAIGGADGSVGSADWTRHGGAALHGPRHSGGDCMLALTFLFITAAAVAASFAKDRGRTAQAMRVGGRSLLGLAAPLLGMTALVGLLLALAPPTQVSRLFAVHGVAGFALISTVGAIITMPAPVAFPLAGSLLKMGVSLPALAAFITTLTMVGVVTAPLEVEYFGRRFTLIRQTLSFALALAIGAVMGVLL
jgi:hypothetical protein